MDIEQGSDIVEDQLLLFKYKDLRVSRITRRHLRVFPQSENLVWPLAVWPPQHPV